MTDDEQRAIETLTSLAKVYKATSGIEDDGSEDVMTQALRRDLPVALAIIDRQASEIKRLLDSFTDIREYWNHDENERAMSDALHVIDDICNRALGE